MKRFWELLNQSSSPVFGWISTKKRIDIMEDTSKILFESSQFFMEEFVLNWSLAYLFSWSLRKYFWFLKIFSRILFHIHDEIVFFFFCLCKQKKDLPKCDLLHVKYNLNSKVFSSKFESKNPKLMKLNTSQLQIPWEYFQIPTVYLWVGPWLSSN